MLTHQGVKTPTNTAAWQLDLWPRLGARRVWVEKEQKGVRQRWLMYCPIWVTEGRLSVTESVRWVSLMASGVKPANVYSSPRDRGEITSSLGHRNTGGRKVIKIICQMKFSWKYISLTDLTINTSYLWMLVPPSPDSSAQSRLWNVQNVYFARLLHVQVQTESCWIAIGTIKWNGAQTIKIHAGRAATWVQVWRYTSTVRDIKVCGFWFVFFSLSL